MNLLSLFRSLFSFFRLCIGGDEPAAEPQRPVNPRNAALAQIAEQAHQAVAADLQVFNEESGEIAAPAADPAGEVAAAPEPEIEAEAPAPVAAPAGPRMLTIIVDGTSIEVEESRILEAGKRTLQKDHAADRRLQEAANTKRQAEALLAQAQRLNTSPDQPAPPQDAPQQSPATQGLDPAALDTYLENKLYVRDAQKAAAKFCADFPEIANDPHLMGIAANLEQQRLETATALGESFGDPYEAYRKHGESVKAWLQQRTGIAPTPAAIDKADRKRTITAIPAVTARAPVQTERKPMTPDELIESIRAKRAAGGRPIHRNN